MILSPLKEERSIVSTWLLDMLEAHPSSIFNIWLLKLKVIHFYLSNYRHRSSYKLQQVIVQQQNQHSRITSPGSSHFMLLIHYKRWQQQQHRCKVRHNFVLVICEIILFQSIPLSICFLLSNNQSYQSNNKSNSNSNNDSIFTTGIWSFQASNRSDHQCKHRNSIISNNKSIN